ncbi:ATP-dependent RNA helicase TDRD9 isoform X2 [Hippocampus comes]|uniref:ATP-dependent RNA helicase TDRD9 isoform X2 n=1 Tax=Hippocampus comes TaxID=109280 RepID=UPI00094E02D1|nr:PREDICTED: putative ATP-dependent RNA helicase TDRD9 isoform X2 [Hippocampus comes]
MAERFTAEQISNWFTSGSAFANIKLTEEAVENKLSGTSKETSPVKVPVEDDLESVNKTKDDRSISESLGSSPAPLASYKYPTFPITKSRQELISLIENNSVVIIRGATGSGKTTQLPQYILDHYNDKNASCNVAVTQPRKIGATSIARWVASQRKCTCGSLVGYQVGLEKMATEHTRLIYMTTGVLLEKLVAAKALTEYSHIFIDEVHERTVEMDFLLLIVRRLLNSNSRYVKVILMSATINCTQFAEYFSNPVRGKMSPAYVFEVEGAPYTIEDFYLDDLQDICQHNLDSAGSDDVYISTAMYKLAICLIENFDKMEGERSSDAVTEGCGNLSERGSVLVFLPGLYEIRYMQQALSTLVHKRLQVFALHSTITMEEQYGVFLSPVPGYRKVILSTNIAESSVTVPDVKYVIDFCLTRQLICDKETNYQSLRLTWASKTNCNQRRGRAGRVSKGYCYRLVTKAFWRNEIPGYMIPEMLVSPLSNIMLKVKLLGMGDPRSLLSTAPSPPNLKDIMRTVLQLKEMGALSAKQNDEYQNDDGELTFLGRVLAHLPVDLYLGKMIVLGHVFGCLDECLIIAACNSMKSFFAIPSMQQLAGHRSKMAFAQGSQSDSVAFVNTFKAWLSFKKQGQLRSMKDELVWGKENFIQIKRIREVAELYLDLKERVKQFNMCVPENTQPSDYKSIHTQKFILQVVIAGAYYPNYFVQGEIDDDLASRELSGFNPNTTVMMRNLPTYSFLYYKQLLSLFRQCGQVKAIAFESSRAYVEFYKTSQDSATVPEVSLALLLAQQKPALELSVYPTEQIEACAGGRQITHLKYARVNVDLQSQSVLPVGVVSSTLDPDKLPPNLFFVVNITTVVDVGHFWGFQADEASLEKQRQLTGEINMRTLEPVTVSLYPNFLCLAPYSDGDEQSLYYRAKILHICGDTVEVFFLDFGNTVSVQCNSLRELPSDLQSHPLQAQEFQVIEMRPSAESIIFGNRWSSRARHRFMALVKGHSVIVSLYSVLHNVMRVQLLISSDTTNRSIVDIFVEEGHAIRAEESFDSKQNHEVLISLYKDIETGMYVPNAASSSWKDRKKEEKQLIDCLLSQFSKTCPPYSRTKVRLHGPSSPYKIQFHCLFHDTYIKHVNIDQYSINTMAVNENPHYKHQRMLVAGSVFINSSGNILPKDTSLMPDIPGLPAIVTMLFTPIMELRTNVDKTRYIGALCGLGWNSETQKGVLPDHDIELAFDVKFDFEDITEINALRVAMNHLACEGPSGTLHLPSDKIGQFQEDCRERLIRLFTKSPPRENVTSVYFDKAGKWNQVEPSLKMDVAEAGTGKSRGVLFDLHPLILLNN